ncbi:hypothetical protein C6497_11370 [Candidatus Poribacteria bacterium]|nr:MAG: hypothetical protein C6497_11370 [Candidatus Poribacteria bacterium]
MKRNLSRELFYFFTEIRKLAVSIDRDRHNSDYKKIGVTEKSYDFVTFYTNTENYLMTIQYTQINFKYKYSITYTISKKNSCMGMLSNWIHPKRLCSNNEILSFRKRIKNVCNKYSQNIKNKKEERHKITQFKNFYNSKKNTDEHRL